MEHATDMIRVVLNAESIFDHLSQSCGSPNIGFESGPRRTGLYDLSLFFLVSISRLTGVDALRYGFESVLTSIAYRRFPSLDGLTSHAPRLSDLRRRQTAMPQINRAWSTSYQVGQ